MTVLLVALAWLAAGVLIPFALWNGIERRK